MGLVFAKDFRLHSCVHDSTSVGGALRDVANSSYGKNFAHAFLNDGIVSMRVNREGKKRERGERERERKGKKVRERERKGGL